MAAESPQSTDHDQRFKTLLKAFLPEFFELFFPDWAERFDFDDVHWLDKEVFPDPPGGSRRSLDLVAKLPLIEGPAESQDWLSLIHVEIESSDSVEPFRRRMHRYYTHLRDAYNLPVLPVAVYLRVGLDGIGTDVYRDFYSSWEVLTFRYLYVGLPALNAIQYLKQNDLGAALSALMKVAKNRRGWLKAESLVRLVDCDQDEQCKYLLMECVQAYLSLDNAPDQQAEYERLIQTEQYVEVSKMATTWLEQGMEQGRRQTIVLLLEKKFGPLDESVRTRVNQWPTEKLDELATGLLTAESLKELGLQN